MKKILIAYASRSGTVKMCVERLAKELEGHQIEIVDLDQKMPAEISDYDFVAVGGPIRMGKLHKRVLSFIENFEPQLANMKVGYFMCCGFTDSADEYFAKNIPVSLLERAFTSECFGGELNPKKHKGFDRFIVHIAMQHALDEGAHDGEMRTANLPSIDPESISRFAGAIRLSFMR